MLPTPPKAPLRSVSEIVHRIALAFYPLGHVGLAVEPVALMADPDDELEGNYVVRASFETPLVEGRRFVTAFQAAFAVEHMATMSGERFAQVVKRLAKDARAFRNQNATDGVVATADRVVNIADVVERTQVESGVPMTYRHVSVDAASEQKDEEPRE